MRPRPRREEIAAAAAVFVAAAAVAGLASMAPRRGLGFIHDEYAYLFQASTFLQGAIALPPPTHPTFFEAPHVLVTPTYAAKYFPGNAAALAPFLAIGMPWLYPCLAFGACAALIFLALRHSGVSLAISALAAALFTGSAFNLEFCPTYLSHCTSTVAGLGSLVLACTAARSKRLWTAAAAGCAIGLALLARPYTGLACLAAAGATLLAARANARVLAACAVPIAAALAILPPFNARITGDPLTSPWRLYAEQYVPSDGPGIGPVDATPPRRPVPANVRPVIEEYVRDRAAYTWASLPRHALRRWNEILDFLPSRTVAALLVVLPFAAGSAAVRFALIWLLALFGLQLSFHASLLQYHVDEFAPLVVLICACAGAALRGVGRARLALGAVLAAQLLFFDSLFGTSQAAAAILFAACAGLLAALVLRVRMPGFAAHGLRANTAILAALACVAIPSSVTRTRNHWSARRFVLQRRFADVLGSLRGANALLFVRGEPVDLLEVPLVATRPPEPLAPLVVPDRGGEDAVLVAEYPRRTPMLLDLSSGILQPLGQGSATEHAATP